MNDEGRALLAAVLAAPDEDSPRLIYADRLTEHGQGERGEFIRVQCRLGVLDAINRGESKGPLAKFGEPLELQKRERHLFQPGVRIWGWIGDWTHRAIPGSPELAIVGMTGRHKHWRFTFRRGFMHHLQCSASDWLQHADAILAEQPVREVTLTTWPGQRVTLFGNSHFSPTTSGWVFSPGETGDEYGEVTILRERNRAAINLLARRWPGITFNLPDRIWIEAPGQERVRET